MGEERFQGTRINAYIRVDDGQYRVRELGIEGVILEGRIPALVEGKSKRVTLTVPFDGQNQLEIKGLKLVCSYGNGETVCYFRELSKSQNEAIKMLLRECNWKRLVPSEKEFMNYTKEERTRELLLSFIEEERKKKLRLLSYTLAVALGLLIVAVFFKLFVLPLRPVGKPLEVAEVNQKEVSQSTSESQTEQTETEEIPDTIEGLPEDLVVSKVEWNNINTMGKVPPYFNPVNPSESAPKETVAKEEQKEQTLVSTKETLQAPPLKEQKQEVNEEKEEKETIEKEEEMEKPQLSESEDYICIQVASDRKPSWLLKVSEELKAFPYVRVEKIGNAYTLRVGFFKEREEAKKVLREIKKRYPRAFMRTCAYRPKRWVHSE
ncbi:SPOR domain-containing protein [Phorcysia thermohydrogeniphila]|uniref:Sporulation related protein n=1 Tax=Phorcysia thermohydrogeniphila TaxID=936138 RepID=A0A4R1GIC7_9BACT|nr:SPOR domain-containing protein [Phorcysia thermohydrogeniphila]TCK06675.1 sporulation related protein [Phorcysia thermohydrogeniphila]